MPGHLRSFCRDMRVKNERPAETLRLSLVPRRANEVAELLVRNGPRVHIHASTITSRTDLRHRRETPSRESVPIRKRPPSRRTMPSVDRRYTFSRRRHASGQYRKWTARCLLGTQHGGGGAKIFSSALTARPYPAGFGPSLEAVQIVLECLLTFLRTKRVSDFGLHFLQWP